MTVESVAADALEDLAGVRHRRKDAAEFVARKAGLYAFYGDGRAWSDLQLAPAFDGPAAVCREGGKEPERPRCRDPLCDWGRPAHPRSGAALRLSYQTNSTLFPCRATWPSPTAAPTLRLRRQGTRA